MTRLAVLGDALLDRDIDGAVERVCPDAPVPVVEATSERPRAGGAALAACLLARDGADVVVVCALGEDAAGKELRRLLDGAGVEVVDVGLGGPTPEKVRIRAAGQSLVRVDRGGSPSPVGPLHGVARAALASAAGVLVADYGRGLTAAPDVRDALGRLRRQPIVWDPHPRGGDPVPGVRLATPNGAEAARVEPEPSGDDLASVAARASALAFRWRTAVSVTLGKVGALVAGHDGPALVVPAPDVTAPDTCGAGDCFAGAALRALAEGAVVSEAVEAAVWAASRFVAAGGAGRLTAGDGAAGPLAVDSSHRAAEVASDVRAGGGTVVAAGGCFDLLHAGHVAMLRAARRLGDCLVVCLNSDASVRLLKGADRPIQEENDRAAVLLALDCVDAVEVFDEPTPDAALARIRPHLFVKGGDYAAADLPEAATLAGWGGRAVVVPYLSGRSSTRLIEEARRARS